MPVLKASPWIHIKKEGYVYSYTKMGDSIVYVCNRGMVKNFDPDLHEGFMRQFVKETGIKSPYVEIRDLKNIQGRGTPRQLAQTKNYILKNQAHLAGFILFPMPFWLGSISRVGFKSYTVSTKFAACKNYEEALLRAVDILEDRMERFRDEQDKSGALCFEQLEFRPEWQYEDPSKGLYYKSGVIPQKVFYSQIQILNLESEDVKIGLPFLEQVFKDGVLKGSKYIRIADYTDVKKASLMARKDYTLAIKRLNKQYDSLPSSTYVCGANLFIRSALNLFSGFVNQKFCFVDSVSDAFAAINSQKEKERQNKARIQVSQKDIDEINELCGRMVWPEEKTDTMDLSPISPDNPLIELSETLTMVQNDLVDLRQIQAEQMENIEQARTKAETASKIKGEFLANMSHEIRTPMNGVIGMLDILIETRLTDEQQHFLEIARQSAVALLGVVNDVLDFSKADSGKITLETIDFDLRELMDSTIDVLSLNAIENGVELGCLISNEVPVRLTSDPGRLRQVLTNLIRNAIKFVAKGEVFVRVSLEEEFTNRVTLLFEVMDTGMGIPENKISTLFEPFTQVDASTTRIYGGTGLGLAISKQLVETMGGKIGVESKVDQGSRFWFTHTAQKQVRQAISPGDTLKRLQDINILILDPHPVSLKIFTAYFQEWSCRYRVANGTDPVLEILKQADKQKDPFLLVLLDRGVTEIVDTEWIQWIHSNAGISKPRLVLVSPHAMGADIDKHGPIKFDGVLAKPIKKKSLLDCLGNAFGMGSDKISRLPSLSDTRNSKDSPLPASPSPNKPLRILVVEDNMVNQKVLLFMLAKAGHHVETVVNGAQAVEIFEKTNFDLILMDIQMPVMGGIDATKKIRQLEKGRNSHTPIVALTANAMKEDREICLSAGMDEYLAKPIQKAPLLEMMNTICRKW